MTQSELGDESTASTCSLVRYACTADVVIVGGKFINLNHRIVLHRNVLVEFSCHGTRLHIGVTHIQETCNGVSGPSFLDVCHLYYLS